MSEINVFAKLAVQREDVESRVPERNGTGVIVVLDGRFVGFVHNARLQARHRALQGPDCVVQRYGVLVLNAGIAQSFVSVNQL